MQPSPRALNAPPEEVFCPKMELDGLCFVLCLNAPSRLRILVRFHVLPCKKYMYQNSWRMLVKSPISKFWFSYLLILFKCWW